jgi:DNA polymerase III gamma/tau subunit
MEHFVSVIFKEEQQGFERIAAGAVASLAEGILKEDETLLETFISEDNEYVYRVEINESLSNDDSDELAESIAQSLFKLGFDDFDIEISY